MDNVEEAISAYKHTIMNFLNQEEERKRYKERDVMEMCYNNGRNNNISNISSASVDSTNNLISTGRPRYPLSANAFLGPAFNACISPHTLELDPTILRYSHSLPAADGFLSQATDPGQLLHHHRRRNHLRSLSSSRGSSPSPLSPIENLETPPSRSPPTTYKATTPTQGKVVGEDVLVMDGILVNAPSLSSGNRAVARSALESSGSTAIKSLYKTEICRSWEDFGTCRYGSKCQFAHGKEEMRPAPHPKFKPEICKAYAATGTCTFGNKCRFSHPLPAEPAMLTNKETDVETPMPAVTETEAEAMIASATNAVDIEAYINQVLYGLTRKQRLPVFLEMYRE